MGAETDRCKMKPVQFLDGITLFSEMTQEEARTFIEKMKAAFDEVQSVVWSDVDVITELPQKSC
jgi:hypothetical protein